MSELARRLSGLLSYKALKENSQNPLTASLSRKCPTFSGIKQSVKSVASIVFHFTNNISNIEKYLEGRLTPHCRQ
jgi:hypothetical protein